MKLLLPKTYYDTHEKIVFFLGGPIRGGGDWQKEAILKLSHAVPESIIVCPCRYKEDHFLYQYKLEGPADQFESQTLWERFYLNIASRQGCILFWIPKQDPLNPRSREDGPYCQDTYGELGEWRGRLMQDNSLNFVLGCEDDAVAGLAQIKKNFRYALKEEFKIHSTLEDVLKEGVKRARK